MPKYLFYIKECLLNPSIFFKQQNDNPTIIQMPWFFIPSAIFLCIVLVHWISNTIIVNDIELDFEGYFLVYSGSLFVGIFLSLFIWLRTWATLKFFGKIKSRTSTITAWCNTPYMFAFFILIFVFFIYMPIFGSTSKIALDQNINIMHVQHGIGLLRGAVIMADIWTIFLIFTAVSKINPTKGKSSLIGGVIIFLLPSIAFILFR